MVVNGREIKFRRTVWANCEIADLSPDGKIERFGELLSSDSFATSMRTAAKFMAILSNGYEMSKAFEDPSYQMRPLSMEEALMLDDGTFADLMTEAGAAFAGDAKTTVETEEPKKKITDEPVE